MGWHPKAETLLWQPGIQEEKRSQTGGVNVRYRRGLKGQLGRRFEALLREEMPYCLLRQTVIRFLHCTKNEGILLSNRAFFSARPLLGL